MVKPLLRDIWSSVVHLNLIGFADLKLKVIVVVPYDPAVSHYMCYEAGLAQM